MKYAIRWIRTAPELPAKSGYRQDTDASAKSGDNPLLFDDFDDAKAEAVVLNEVGHGGYFYEAVEYAK